jgi:hypothetical protein
MLEVIGKPETIIAIASLVLSVATFAFVYLRPSKTSAFLGPTIIAGYTEKGVGFSLQVPVTFVNNGAKAGSVFRAAILLGNSPNKQYFMQWYTFLKLDNQQVTLRWIHEELAHILTIPANSSVARLILFGWVPTSVPALKIEAGSYDLEFFFWNSDSSLPHCQTHKILISPEDLTILEDRSDPANLRTVSLQLDQQLGMNTFYKNEFEARALRKLPLKDVA